MIKVTHRAGCFANSVLLNEIAFSFGHREILGFFAPYPVG